MKIKKREIKTTQLLELQIIKSKILNQKKSNFLENLSAQDISKTLIKLKKSIQIVFKFHKQQKKILFVGIPKQLEDKINMKTNHVAVPNFYNIYGLFINKSVAKSLKFKYQMFENKNKVLFSKLFYKPDLIVIFNSKNSESIVKEGYTSKIPIIQFNSNFRMEKKNKLCSYDVPGDYTFNKKSVNNIFFKIINSILKK